MRAQPPSLPRLAPPLRAGTGTRVTSRASALLTDVIWTPSYAALLLYVVIITTYRIGFGSVVIAVGIFGLFLEHRPRLSGMMLWLGVFFCWAVLSLFSSPWPDVARGELIEFMKVAAIGLVATTTLNSRARIRLFMVVALAAFALYPARGAIFNYFLGGYSLLGRAIWNNIFANPNDMAAFTLLQLSVAVAIFATERRGLYRWGAAASLVVLPLVILLTQSRGVFLGLAVFGFIAVTTHRRKARIVGLVGLVGLIAVLLLPSGAWERFGMVRTIGEGGTGALASLQDDGSAQQRYEIWQTSFRIVSDQPIFGIGWGTYALGNQRYAPQLGARDAHSTYLDIAAEIGIPGLLLFLGLVGATLRRSHHARRRLLSVNPAAAQQIRFLTLGLLGFLVAAIFATYSGITLFYLHIALIWAVTDTHLRDLTAGARAARATRKVAVHQRMPY